MNEKIIQSIRQKRNETEKLKDAYAKQYAKTGLQNLKDEYNYRLGMRNAFDEVLKLFEENS